MDSRLRSLVRRITRFWFTLASLAFLSASGILTQSIQHRLSSRWLELLGFAPIDLLSLNGYRALTSAMVTGGERYFWQAFGMVAVVIGTSELIYGSRRSFLAFWGLHCGALLIQSVLIVLPLSFLGYPLGAALAQTRDAGPSTSYMGVLGLVGARLGRPWSWLVIIGAGIVLSTAFFRPPHPGQNPMVKLAADLDHCIAFPLGCLLSLVWKKGEGPQ